MKKRTTQNILSHKDKPQNLQKSLNITIKEASKESTVVIFDKKILQKKKSKKY